MPDRLNRIVTRGGDRGETSLGDGSRVSKADSRIALIGDIDELNSWIGVVIAHDPGAEVLAALTVAQHDLFDLGGAVSIPGAPVLSEAHVARIESAAVTLNAALPPLKEFILPGGSPMLAWLHVARTVCRRAERAAVTLYARDEAGGHALAYLNRMSDFLFIAARAEARSTGVSEVLWHHDKNTRGDR